MFFDQIFLENTLKEWVIALGITILSIVLLKAVLMFLQRKIKKLSLKTITIVDDIIAELFIRTKLFFVIVVGLFIGAKYLSLPDNISSAINTVFMLVFLVQIALWGSGIITFLTNYYREQKLAEDSASVTTVSAASFVGKLVVWVIILLLALDNLGVNITTLVASLGIGGIAIALALQNILGDLFASLSIVFDKPFVIGDFIKVDDNLGTIENIGLKDNSCKESFRRGARFFK